MNVIHLLPNTVADQIAAGEVIQRPASVIKELMENAIDAGATSVKVIVQDAGRTQIQVIDDGCGMNETDARLAFERHATSKISSVRDLENLATMGFRGEALASIAAVAQVELLTRTDDAELGVKIVIAASEVESQEPCATPKGSRFCVKNLFYNVPARRRFLKSDTVELRHICSEFIRVALAHPDIAVSLTSNGSILYNMPAGNKKQRILSAAGKSQTQQLLSIDSDTSLVKISGFIGTPHTARKTSGDQYFFANNRYMRSPYFNKAVTDAYKGIIAPDQVPAFYIYLDVDPRFIDVNVHPQKTEIKFEDDQAIWKILNSTVSACLNRNNILPSIDFDSGERVDIPTFKPNEEQGGYNPFEHENRTVANYMDSFNSRLGTADETAANGSYFESSLGGGFDSGLGSNTANRADSYGYEPRSGQSVDGWTNIYSALGGDGSVANGADNSNGSYSGANTTFQSALGAAGSYFESALGSSTGASQPTILNSSLFADAPDLHLQSNGIFMQLRGRYIVTTTAQGLTIVDQHRAHERVLYNKLRTMADAAAVESQRLLFAETMPVGADDACIISELTEELRAVGIEVGLDQEKGILEITTIPAMMDTKAVRELIETLTYDCRTGEVDIRGGATEYMLRSLAKHGAMPYGRTLAPDEMKTLFEQLMDAADNARTPAGKQTFRILADADVEALFRT